MPKTALDEKAADEEVTWGEIQQAHEQFKDEFNRHLKDWWDEKEKYLREQGIGMPSDLQEQWEEMNETVDELEKEYKEKLEAYRRSKEDGPSDEEKAYRKFLKKGKEGTPAEDLKLLQTDQDSSGGLLLPRNRRNEILERARASSPMRALSQVVTISSGDSWEQPVEGTTQFDSGWVSERESRSETTSGDIELVKIPVHEQYAKPVATQKMLEDPAFDLPAYIDRKVGRKFMREEAKALVKGNGEGKPRGFLTVLTNGNHSSKIINTGDGSNLTYQGILDLVYDIEENVYIEDARLMFNRKTMAKLRGLTDDQNMPIYDPGTPEEGPAIEGFPFETATHMPTVASNAHPIAFGDFRTAYTVVDRLDVTLLRDPLSSKPNVEFYFRRRVGGDLVLPEALRLQKVAA